MFSQALGQKIILCFLKAGKIHTCHSRYINSFDLSDGFYHFLCNFFFIKDPMDIRTIYILVKGSVLFCVILYCICDPGKALDALPEGSLSHMDLITFQIYPGQCMKEPLYLAKGSFHPGSGLSFLKHRIHRQKTHAFDLPSGFHMFRVGESFSQHLIAAANAKDDLSLRSFFQHSSFQAILPHPQQVFHSVLGSRQDDHIRIFQFLYMAHISKRYSRDHFQSIKICEIGDPWHPDHGNVDEAYFLISGKPFCQAVLILYLQFHIRSHSHYRDMSPFLQHFHSRIQYGLISPEFIDDHAFHHFLLIRLQEHDGSHQLGENSSPVNITYQKYRSLGHFRHAHVNDIFFLQIDLRRASGSFNHNNIIFFRQCLISFHYFRHQLLFVFKIISGAHGSQDFPVYDHLAAYVISRFQ